MKINDDDRVMLNWQNFHNHCLNCPKCKKIFANEINDVWNHMLEMNEGMVKIIPAEKSNS